MRWRRLNDFDVCSALDCMSGTRLSVMHPRTNADSLGTCSGVTYDNARSRYYLIYKEASIHDGGAPLLKLPNGRSRRERLFDDSDLECWSSFQCFHPVKFPDSKDFSTYKEPLKLFFRKYNGNETFTDAIAMFWSTRALVAPLEHPVE